ncbi:putative ribonuclease H protein, partial [Trifolium medium]|nr:putative ribonuclease H protein [Trifolium medium]
MLSWGIDPAILGEVSYKVSGFSTKEAVGLLVMVCMNIKVWEDNWIPSLNGFKLLTWRSLDRNVSGVRDLIDEGHFGWNTGLLERLFYGFEVDSITQIPLINPTLEDKFMWMGEKHWDYTVKSGYQAIKNWEQESREGGSGHNSSDAIWKKLWNLKIPPRNQLLIWRIIHNIVPVRENLNNRGVRSPILCPNCSKYNETTDRAFRKCHKVKDVWSRAQVGNNANQTTMQFQDWLYHKLNNTDSDTMAYIATL